jgi:hypothetical protein
VFEQAAPLSHAAAEKKVLTNTELNRIYLSDVANAKSAADKKAAFEKFKAATPVDENFLGALLGRKLTTPDQVSQGIIDAQKQSAVLKADLDKALAGEQGIATLRGELKQVFDDLDRLQSSRSVASTGLQQQFAPIFDELRRLRNDSQITDDELNKVIEARNKLGTDATTGGGIFGTSFASIDKIGFASTLNELDAALTKLQAIKGVQDSIGDSSALQSQLQLFQDVLQQAAPDVKFQAVATALQQAASPAEQIAESMERAANAAERAANAAGGIGAVNRAMGGPIAFRAFGGRGTDTVPAMLSPGEFVVSAKSSQRWFSQLQAMNAGQQPVFRDNGGTVNNSATFGDINISGSSSPGKTARAVAKELRREFRRGTSRL